MKHLVAAMVSLVAVACGGGATEPGAGPPAGSKMNRMPFAQVFKLEQGRIEPKRPVQVGGTSMSRGVSMACGSVKVDGVDLCTLAGHDLGVEQQGDTLVIKGYYK